MTTMNAKSTIDSGNTRKRYYKSSDLVRISQRGCEGCGECCRGMGDTIVLDPYDACQLSLGLSRPFGELIGHSVELHVECGLLLPHLAMTIPLPAGPLRTPSGPAGNGSAVPSTPAGNGSAMPSEAPSASMAGTDGAKRRPAGTPSGPAGNGSAIPSPAGPGVARISPAAPEACAYLDSDGRCRIHAFRPGICRLYPLAREFTGQGVRYFLLDEPCPVPGRSKLRIDRYLGIQNLPDYEAFKLDWHFFVRDMEDLALRLSENNEELQKLSLFFLETFFLKPYDYDSFYATVRRRMLRARRALGLSAEKL